MTVFVKFDFNAADDNTQTLPPTDSNTKSSYQTTKMPKKKSKAAQTAPLVSDYETDTYTTDQAPPVQQLSNAELNHLVLQRWCPSLQTILAISPFAVLYNFNPDTAAWEKSDLQGSLFVLQLQDPARPRYEVMILNRKHPENLHLAIDNSENIEVTEEFVILHIEGGEGQTVGLWMFSDEETPVENRLESIAAKIMECAVMSEAYNGVSEEYVTDGVEEGQHYVEQPQPQQQPVKEEMRGQSIDLATLFGRPQQPEPQPQQNVLLDLFKNATKG